VDSFSDVYADDVQIGNASITAVSGNSNDGKVTSTRFANAMWVRRYAGTASQTVDWILNNRYPSVFTSNFRGRGVAYVASSFDWGDGKMFQGPPIMTFVVKGKKCYDPRLDSSPGADPTNASYIAWTDNPALCWADYLMADFGGAVSASQIDWASVVTAADICDETVPIPSGSSQKRYTFNGRIILPVEPDWRENAKLFVDAMLGRMVRRDGKWFVYAGAWEDASYTIEKTDWLSIERIRTVAPRDGGRWNTVRCWYVDASRNWQRVECFPRRNSTYRSADGAEEITLEMEQPACDNEYEAQRKAEFMLRQSRNQIAVTGRLPPRFRKMATGEVVAVNFEELGWVSKLMRIRSMDMLPDGSVNVGLVEEQEADWADLEEAEYNAESIAAVPATNPTTPSAPSSLTIDSLTIAGTLMFDIGDPVVRPIGTRFQIIRSAVSTNAAVGTVVFDGASQHGTIFAPSSTSYYFSRAYANSYAGPYFPNTTGIAVGPARVLLNNASANSSSLADREIANPILFTPDATGALDFDATIEGFSTFDKDSGTYFQLAALRTALVNSALGVPIVENVSSATAEGAFQGAIGWFIPSSLGNRQIVTLTGQWSVASGTQYTLGVMGRHSAGSQTFTSVAAKYNFVRF
jgi:hypothetical protein